MPVQMIDSNDAVVALSRAMAQAREQLATETEWAETYRARLNETAGRIESIKNTVSAYSEAIERLQN